MLEPGDRVVVGLSGGADSVCLATLLSQCRDELGITVEAAHLNHCIRGAEADSDEEFVVDFCEKNGIRLHIRRVDIPGLASESGESIELCARKARYKFFSELNADKIATAHTGSDRIETMLINLSRGSSLNGLCSIPAVRDNIIRPLICFTREDIEKYCSENNISYVTDSSNLSDEYTRNKFRHKVVAELKEINPSFERNSLRCLEIINCENSFLIDYANRIMSDALTDGISLSIKVLKDCDKRIAPRVVAAYLNSVCEADYEMRHIDYIFKHLEEKFSVTLPGGVIVSGNGNTIFTQMCKNTFTEFSPIDIKSTEESGYSVMGKSIYISFSKYFDSVEENTFVADADKLQGNLVLRTRKSGDVFHLGRRKCSKPLNKLFNESRVPSSDRDRLLVVSDDNGVVFVEHFGVDSLREINKETKKYLIIKIKEDKND